VATSYRFGRGLEPEEVIELRLLDDSEGFLFFLSEVSALFLDARRIYADMYSA
jgi:hypothetical protein